jgi:hypothetical protein
MNLSSLSRVWVSYDYENTLLSLNRGDEIQTKLTPTQDDVAVGIAMTPAIIENGAVKSGPPNPTKLTMSTALNNYGVLGESRPKGMLASNSLVCITSELPVIRAQSDGMPPLAVRRFGRIVLSQCAAARVLLDKRRHKYERQ